MQVRASGRGWCRVLLHLLVLGALWREREALPTVKIGALLAFDSPIGNVALKSLQLAVQDVNANTSTLPTHELVLEAVDSSCGPFQGAAAAVELLKGEVVAVAGPQTSAAALFASALGIATRVPFVSFAATEPALTKANNPYFLRTVHNDGKHMEALAQLVNLYGWREISAISTDDGVGLNALDVLSDGLTLHDINLVYRGSISPEATVAEIERALNDVAMVEARVIVVHLQPSIARLFFTTARAMSMVNSGYVWLASEALSIMFQDVPATDSIWTDVQGVVGVRSYIPPSSQLTAFHQRLASLQQPTNLTSTEHVVPASVYGVRAYDTVWMLARAIDSFLQTGNNFTFVTRDHMPVIAGGATELGSLKILASGGALLQEIKGTQFDSISGHVELDSHGDLVESAFEVLNLIGTSPRVVGYWNSDAGFSRLYKSSNGTGGFNGSTSPSSKVAFAKPSQLQDIIWPGGSSQVPKGWTVAHNGERLSIAVPLKTGFEEFVNIQTDASNVTTYHGFCIDVFMAAVSYLPYSLNYTYVPYGDGNSNPSYDDMVESVAEKRFDAAVGDVTITTKRSKIVDFTQPYTASGLVVVVPAKAAPSSHAWAFMRPFTPSMWITTGAFFLFTGLAIWILEHKKNRDFRGRPRKQLVTVLWFIFSTLFFSQREKTKSTLGRAVLIIWLFVVLIVISSYTASLTSILTVQQLLPTVQGISGLVSSTLSIGFQAGSFVEDYLLQLNVPQRRLVALDDQTSFASAMDKGLVGAVVDELPYVQLFLASECGFTIAGQEFTKSGWGFAFQKGSQLAVDMSTAILQMAEDGHLQQIHDYWLVRQNCASSSALNLSSNKLGLSTFWGLFLITGTASIACVVLYYSRLIWQHHKTYVDDDTETDRTLSWSSRHRSFLRSLVSFIEEKEVDSRREERARNNSARNSRRGRRRSSEYGTGSGDSGRSDDQTAAATPERLDTVF